MREANVIKIAQSDSGRWYILSRDEERLLSNHATARQAAISAVNNYEGAFSTLILEFEPYQPQREQESR